MQSFGLNKYHDCESQYILVPCGHCSQCIALKQSYIVQRTQMEAINFDLWMLTLTYNEEMIKSINVNGYKYRYADISDLQNMFKRIRKYDLLGCPFQYLAVTEYGTKNHRPHYHVILATPKNPDDDAYDRITKEERFSKVFRREWRRNIATCYNKHGELVSNTRNPLYKPLHTHVVKYIRGERKCNFDFHWIDPKITDSSNSLHDESDVAFYVTKYLTKSNKWLERVKSALKFNLEPEHFKEVWSLLRPKMLISKNFGYHPLFRDSIFKHLRQGIDLALNTQSPFPYFINPNTGETFPLCPVYRKHAETIADLQKFYEFRRTSQDMLSDESSVMATNSLSPIEIRQKSDKFAKIQNHLFNRLEDENTIHEILSGTTSEEFLDPHIDSYLDYDSLVNSVQLYDDIGIYIDEEIEPEFNPEEFDDDLPVAGYSAGLAGLREFEALLCGCLYRPVYS